MWGNGRPRALQALRCGFESRHSLQRSTPFVVSTQHAGLLTREVVVRVHPEGPMAMWPNLAEVESLSSGGSNPPMVTTIIGSWRNRQTRHAQTVQIGVRIPASRPALRRARSEFERAFLIAIAARSPGAWQNWPTRPAQTRLNATGLRPGHMWVRIAPLGPS